jgi:hypothetical protein
MPSFSLKKNKNTTNTSVSWLEKSDKIKGNSYYYKGLNWKNTRRQNWESHFNLNPFIIFNKIESYSFFLFKKTTHVVFLQFLYEISHNI